VIGGRFCGCEPMTGMDDRMWWMVWRGDPFMPLPS
jgi:hypothetical protein